MPNDLFVAHVLAKDIQARQRQSEPLVLPNTRRNRYQAFMERLRHRLLG